MVAQQIEQSINSHNLIGYITRISIISVRMKPGKSIHDQILQKYGFKKDKPIYQMNNYKVYNGQQTETALPVTIKMLQSYNSQLPKYLKKLKDTQHENVIKVYEMSADASSILFITEQVTYGTLKNGLKNCHHLDQSDSLFLVRSLLAGHIDLLRADCNWFGNEDDIEFTDTGIKLSWNNGMSYNLVNPFPVMIQKISSHPLESGSQSGSLLPFPKSKLIQQLVKVSKENASELSLHPQLKKKQKFAKKKGKQWMGLKEYKNKNQYFDQTSYFAVSELYGFIRVKVYEAGHIEPAQLNLNKTKANYTKVLENYEENNKTILLSDYSNDGNLQSYVTKLKSSGVTLKEDQIEFFFYSLFEPLKQVQDSQLKSINMLHIKNIYIENGIPKIGEPVPMNNNLISMLNDREQVPDFYHPKFKKNPNQRDSIFDTYSLGVLLYKLMYTEYPIFPEHKVHIPTTPNYNKRLKTTLEIFLNEGGALKDIESKIEVSENVVKQVKENKQKLIVAKKIQQEKLLEVRKGRKKGGKGGNIVSLDEDEHESAMSKDTLSRRDIQQEQEQEGEDGIGCCATLCAKLKMGKQERAKQQDPMVTSLQESPYRMYRICAKILLVLIFYIFLFYFFFISNVVTLYSTASLLYQHNVTIATVNYTITTSSKTAFETQFNTTNKTVASLVGLGCFIDNYNNGPVYSNYIFDNSGLWIGYISGAIGGIIVILLIKVLQIYHFDMIKMRYFRQQGYANFNILNFIIFGLFWIDFIHQHFYYFNYVFFAQVEPCVGSIKPYHSFITLFQDIKTFLTVYTVTIGIEFLIVFIFLILLIKTRKVPYNKLFNPVVIFVPPLIVSYVVCRIGVISGYFTPSALSQDSYIILSYFTQGNYIGVFGTIPQILWIGQLLIVIIIDYIFWGFIDKRRRMLIGIDEPSQASINDDLQP